MFSDGSNLKSRRKVFFFSALSILAVLGITAMVVFIMLLATPGGLGEFFAPSRQKAIPAGPKYVTPYMKSVSIGDIIPFGSHYWRVLNVQYNQALIITENIIGYRMFHDSLEAVTWETSEIRRYLNNIFFKTFGEADRARILETEVINNNNPWDFSDWGWTATNTPGGNNTIDRVFLLSIDEVLQYFGDSGLVEAGTTMGANARDESTLTGLFAWGVMEHNRYSEARRAIDSEGWPSWWWLRSPGISPRYAAIVMSGGFLHLSGEFVFWFGATGGGIRPALWLCLAH